MAVTNPSREDQDRQGQGDQKKRGLGKKEDLLALETVDHDSRKEGEEENRRELKGSHEAEKKGGAGKGVSQPRLGDVLHPCSDQGHPHSQPVEAKVPMLQGNERVVQFLSVQSSPSRGSLPLRAGGGKGYRGRVLSLSENVINSPRELVQ